MIQIARKKKFLYILLPADFIYKHVSYIPRIAFMILPVNYSNIHEIILSRLCSFFKKPFTRLPKTIEYRQHNKNIVY